MKISSPKASDLSPDCASDPEEKEVSDEDDDDRNHKHRRRETRSQSLERDSVDQVFTRPHRKHNKTTENGHIFRESESQGNETWKNYNVDKDLAAKFDRRLQGFPLVSRAPYDQNQRSRTNQTFIGDPGHGRGRGRDGGSWNHRDSRFSAAGIASQMVQPGAVPPNIFPGRGLPSVSNSQNPSWGAFALMPGIPNGGLDALHSVGLPGTLRPQLTPSLNMGIPRQRCRDFEERGFCLRGEMCPMEHGMNRIVVDDVQVAVLKEHFSQYGDLSSVELDGEGHDQGDGSETPRSCSALVSFTSRQSAERAFVNGKSWQGHNLQLAWLASRNFDIILYPHNFLKEFMLC